MGLGLNSNKSNKSNRSNKNKNKKSDDFMQDLDDIKLMDFGDDDSNNIETREFTEDQHSKKSKPIKNKSGKNKTSLNKKGILKIVIISFFSITILITAIFALSSRGSDTGKGVKPKSKENSSDLLKSVDNGSELVPSGGQDSTKTSTTSSKQQSNKEASTSFKPGTPDLQHGTSKSNETPNTNSNDFLKEVTSGTVKDKFEVEKISMETDFINFKKKRGATGKNVELYWLEAEYKGRPYSVQVPFKIFKELDEQGITVVNVEVLHLKGGEQIVSYMSVRDDYKKLLEKR